jgi:hypothetical protein
VITVRIAIQSEIKKGIFELACVAPTPQLQHYVSYISFVAFSEFRLG